MRLKFTRISYERLNARQKEAYNFQKVSAVLAEYGYVTIRLSSDWQGADFIAQHSDGSFLKVQLKARLTFARKYLKHDLHICFRSGDEWFLYPHDELLAKVMKTPRIKRTKSWEKNGLFHYPIIPQALKTILTDYRL